MAFKYQTMGALIASRPREAVAQLRSLFAEHKSIGKVAEAVGADARTLRRWITKLEEQGHSLKRLPRGRPNRKPRMDARASIA